MADFKVGQKLIAKHGKGEATGTYVRTNPGTGGRGGGPRVVLKVGDAEKSFFPGACRAA